MRNMLKMSKILKVVLTVLLAVSTLFSLVFSLFDITSWSVGREITFIVGIVAFVTIINLIPEEENDKRVYNPKYIALVLTLLVISVVAIVSSFMMDTWLNTIEDGACTDPTLTPSIQSVSKTPEERTPTPVTTILTTPTVDPAALTLFNQGKAYYDEENFNSAYPLLFKSAQYGYSEAELYVGYCYFDGTGAKQDEAKAFYWLSRSADQGLAKAQYLVGYCYISAIGVPRNDEQAFTYFKKAADQNDSKGLLWTGYCYQYGIGTEVNDKYALEYYEAARAQGNVNAQTRINELLS